VRNSARLESLAREGHAFGVGIVMGTQFPGDVPETMAGNLATQLFLMNNQAKHRSWIVRQIYGTTTGRESKELLDKLGRFKPLDGLFSNPHHQMALLRPSRSSSWVQHPQSTSNMRDPIFALTAASCQGGHRNAPACQLIPT
jgi:hypothetical protein